MLNVVIGKCPDVIFKTAKFFDYEYEPEWITDELSIKMIKDVDNSEVIDRNIILSPIFGTMPPQWLSGGVKTLMLIYFIDNKIFNISQCGDNCVESLLEIGNRVNRTVWLGHIMKFTKPNEVNKKFKIKLIYDNMEKSKVVNNMIEFLEIYNEYNEFYI